MQSNFDDKFATNSEIARDRRLLRNPYAHLDENGQFSALKATKSKASSNEIITSRVIMGNQYAHLDENGGFSATTRKKDKYSSLEIERKVRAIHKLIWKNRHVLWEVSPNHVDMLDPIKAFELLGYSYSIESSLGEFRENGKLIEAAGLIDNESRRVSISHNFRPEVRRFTAAHELGHALLHSQNGLHRDKPLDGTVKARVKSEYEADFFASRFLMPEKLLKSNFKKRFLTESFLLNEDTASGFRIGSYETVLSRCNSDREFSRFIAKAEQYNGKNFISLAAQFKVSVEAMAIRLEELELILPLLARE